MASEFIGLIVGIDTRTVYSVVNPEEDIVLDNPCHLQLGNERGEPVRMVKVRRADYGYHGEMSIDDVHELLVSWYVGESEVYRGPEIIVGAV